MNKCSQRGFWTGCSLRNKMTRWQAAGYSLFFGTQANLTVRPARTGRSAAHSDSGSRTARREGWVSFGLPVSHLSPMRHYWYRWRWEGFDSSLKRNKGHKSPSLWPVALIFSVWKRNSSGWSCHAQVVSPWDSCQDCEALTMKMVHWENKLSS